MAISNEHQTRPTSADMEKPHVQGVENVPSMFEEASPGRIPPRTYLALIAINFIIFAQINSIIGSGILAVQTTEFLGDKSKAPWLSMALTIFTLALNPPLSQAADYWGRKWFMVVTSLGGFVGPLVIARASSVNMLLAGFCLLGIACGCQAFFYLIPSEILPRRHRPAAQASLNISTALGAATAILMGGALLGDGGYNNYRIYWYVVAGLYAFAVVGLVLGYNPPLRELQVSLTTREKLSRLDWIGYFLLIVGFTLFCIALQWSKNPYSWNDVHILAPFILAMLFLAIFGVYEYRFRKDGILHHHLFHNKNFVIAIFAVFVEGLAFFACNSYFTFEMQVLLQVSLFSAGLRFLVLFAASIVSAVVVGFYTIKTKRPRDTLIAGFVFLALFNSLMAAVKTTTPTSVFWGYPILAGVGLGFLLTNLAVITQLSTPRDMISLTTGVFTAGRSLGASVGLAINTALFNEVMSSKLGPRVGAAVFPLGFFPENLGALIGALGSGHPEDLAKIPGMTPEIAAAGGLAVKEVYILAFRNVWIAAAAFSAFGIIAFFLQDMKSEFTHEIDAPMTEAPIENMSGQGKQETA